MRMLNTVGLVEMGFPYYGWLIAIQAGVVRMASRLGIGLIFYGEDGEVDDIECRKFIVALTRTLKRCYLLSNKWDYSPKVQKPFTPSVFIQLIPNQFLDDKGYLVSKNITP